MRMLVTINNSSPLLVIELKIFSEKCHLVLGAVYELGIVPALQKIRLREGLPDLIRAKLDSLCRQ